MTKRNENEAIDDLAPELRRALIECGAVIPTTPEEVALVETKAKSKLSTAQIESAFNELKEALKNPDDDLSFVKANSSVLELNTEELSMAARHGNELDADIRATEPKKVWDIRNGLADEKT